MVTVTLIHNGRDLSLKAHYEYRHRMHKIGAVWDYTNKVYTVPKDDLYLVEAEFSGEIYYKTPRYKITGEPKPEQHFDFVHDITVPKLKLKPYEYQNTGIKFMVDRILEMGFCLNGDSVGLGKTVESVGTMLWFKKRGAKKFLVICKKSLKYQWASEIKKFSDMDNIFVAGDTPKKRKDAYDGIKGAKEGILITNYHNYLSDTKEIAKTDFDLVVIDEVHSIKSSKSKMHKNIMNVTLGRNVAMLSGTPVMSKPEDIFGIVELVDPEYFGSYKEFKRNFLITQPSMYGYHMEEVIGIKNLPYLQELIGKFMIRRTTDDVSLELPEISGGGIGEDIICEADSTQEKMLEYITGLKEEIEERKKRLLDKNKVDLKGDIPPDVREAIDEINEKSKQYIHVLQFISDDPSIFPRLKATSHLRKELIAMVPKNYSMSNKMEKTVDMVEEIVSSGEKVLIFSHFATPAVRLAREIADKLKCEVSMYTGSENDSQREKSIDGFVNGDVPVMIGTEAAAEGLNLQVARYLINFEMADTYAQHTQRIGRLRRIGSEYSHITVFNMVTEDSFDKTKLEKIKRDRNLAGALVEDAATRIGE